MNQILKEREKEFARSNVRTMNKLAMNMATFAVSSVPILVVLTIATVNLKRFIVLGW